MMISDKAASNPTVVAIQVIKAGSPFCHQCLFVERMVRNVGR